MASQEGVVLYCDCAISRTFSDETRKAAQDLLRRCRWPVVAAKDLCGLVARRDPGLASVAEASQVRVAACHARSVRALLRLVDPSMEAKLVAIVDLHDPHASEQIASWTDPSLSTAPSPSAWLGEDSGWIPWFPIIDQDRCRQCRQCLDFCLFGVYSLDEEGRVVVSHPERCKTGCPACARICPSVAILFPKCGQSPIDGGEMPGGDSPKTIVPLDVDLLSPDGLRSKLAERRRLSGKRLLKKDAVDPAVRESDTS